MAVITEYQLKNALLSGRILPNYILYGDDGYLLDRYEALIIDKTCGKGNDFDLQKFERDVDLQAVFDSVNQYPFSADRRCTILSDYNFESASDDDFNRLLSLVSDSYETATLILRFDGVEFDPKHSKKAGKLLESCEKSGGAVVVLNHRTPAELSKMLTNGARKRGKVLEKRTADYILENCGLDINLLAGELDKVCRYVDNDIITKDDIDLVCTKSVEASIYEYVKKIILCDTEACMTDLNNLFFMRVEPILILYSVASAFVDIERVNAANKVHVSLTTLAADFPYRNKEFVLRNANQNLKKLDDKKLNLCLNEILSADRDIKSFSNDNKLVLEQMTIKLIYIIAHGETVD